MLVFVGARMTSSASGGRDRSLDADRDRLAEVDLHPVVPGQRLANDLLLDLAIERDRDLASLVVLADVDEWVLLGELSERPSETSAVSGPPRCHDRFERGRREHACDAQPLAGAEDVTHADVSQAGYLRDLPGNDNRPLDQAAGRHHLERGHPALAAVAVARRARAPCSVPAKTRT